MDDLQAIEQRIAREMQRRAGPSLPVDDRAIFEAVTATTQFQRWRLGSIVSATKLAVAAVFVTLFGGFLLAGLFPPSSDRQASPRAVSTSTAPSSASTSPSIAPEPSVDALVTDQPGHTATAQLVVDPGPDASTQDLALARVALAQYAARATTPSVAESVIAKLDLDDDPEAVLERITTETSDEALLLTLWVSGDDPEVARALAQALGDELRQRVNDELVTDEVKAADRAIARIQNEIRVLQRRLDNLRNKSPKTPEDRAEIQPLIGQIANLRDEIAQLRPASPAFVRNRLEWFGTPTTSGQMEPSPSQDGSIPTREIVVATQGIEQGTTIDRLTLTTLVVPSDVSNEMALTDPRSVAGREAAIDILAHQPITPNMLVDE